MGRMRNLWVLLGLVLFTVTIYDFHVSADVTPSENECRPYIEKAIHELKNVEAAGADDNDKDSNEGGPGDSDSIEAEAAPESGTEDDGKDSGEGDAEKSLEDDKTDDDDQSDDDTPSQENQTEENASVDEATQEEKSDDSNQENDSKQDDDSKEVGADAKSAEQDDDKDDKSDEKADDKSDDKDDDKSDEKADDDKDSKEQSSDDADSKEQADDDGDSKEKADGDNDDGDSKEDDSKEDKTQDGDDDSKENTAEDDNDSKEDDANDTTENKDSAEPADDDKSEQANDDDSSEKDGDKTDNDSVEDQTAENDGDSKEDQAADGDSKEDSTENNSQDAQDDTKEDESVEEKVRAKRSIPDEAQSDEKDDSTQNDSTQNDDNDSQEKANDSQDNDSTDNDSQEDATDKDDGDDSKENADDNESEEENEETDEDDLTMEFEIPKNLRPHEHVNDLLGLDAESSIKENALKRTGDVVLKELKKVFDNAIKPLETMYKYRDLSNRHFGDPEIFSKPLVLFMGPWSGGKSTILNYLTDNEYTANSIRSGAEPSPAYFNILMHGDEPEVLDGTQLAADWTFSGLQKFGQGLMDRLRGQKLPSKLLERVNIVEIPGILEVRKQVSRYFPFNDACQWFIDRADIIFLVYDPSKLDVGPETEAILDQLKGREYQTRILLNKADQVKPEELLRVQGALIWNISPLMSSAQPPIMYTVSLWSHPYENGAPIRLLQAQERAMLADLREAIDRRIENKIASARRFAVRIRNHAKMVDCYLSTYYNQKGLFSNKKNVADKIIEHPQNYNIYEGLSTLTNISRYDLPDPEVYLDFFRLNPLYDFKKLAETCTYFKGCPINKLDIAIAYDLPELVGKYKKLQEQNLKELRKEYDDNCNQTEPEPPVKIIKSR